MSGSTNDNNAMAAESTLNRKVLAAVERLGRALRAGRQQVATRHALSLLGVSILEILADGRACRVGDLAAELDVSQPTASDALATLDTRGLVQRQRDPDDLRATLVSLSGDGVELSASIAAELTPLLVAHTGSTIERATTLRVLLGEIARLQAAGVITINRSCLTCHHFQPPHGRAPGRCLLLDCRLSDRDLRVDCPEHEGASLT